MTVITNRTPIVGHAAIFEEFDIYIAEPVHPTIAPAEEDGHHQLDMDFSPLTFWKTNAHRFPLLAEVAKEIFGIPASSASIERHFSTALDIISSKRNRLKPTLFRSMMKIKKNRHLVHPSPKTVSAK